MFGTGIEQDSGCERAIRAVSSLRLGVNVIALIVLQKVYFWRTGGRVPELTGRAVADGRGPETVRVPPAGPGRRRRRFGECMVGRERYRLTTLKGWAYAPPFQDTGFAGSGLML